MTDDIWKALGIGIFGLFVVHGSLEPRVRRDAVAQVQESFHNTGTVRASVKARGALGLLANDIYSVDVYGENNKASELPFQLYPRGGWKGSIRHLRVHLKNFELNGLKVAGMEGDIPFVKYDITHALLRDRLHLRGAEQGTATVILSAENIRAFLEKKFGNAVTEAVVAFEANRIVITGKFLLLASRQPFRAVSGLAIKQGRIELVDMEFLLNNRPLPAVSLASILKQMNPVLDVGRDLNMEGIFMLRKVSLLADTVRVEGDLRLPIVHFINRSLPWPPPKPGIPPDPMSITDEEGEREP